MIASSSAPPIFRATIPDGLRPGDHFLVHIPDSPPLTLMVPPNSKGGDFIDIGAPAEITESTPILVEPAPITVADQQTVTLNKASTGSAILGGVVGLFCCGPIGAILCCGGAYYLSGMPNSGIGARVHSAGTDTCNCLLSVHHYVNDRIIAR